jgi:hypothetical protein
MNAEASRLAPNGDASVRGNVRAYWVAQGGEFLRHHFEADVRAKIEHAFSSELNSALTGRSMSDWVARAHLVELLEATAKARGGFEAASDLAAYGEFIQRRASNRFGDLLTKILTPELLLRKLPLFWQRDFGLPGNCVVDACAVSSARFQLEGVADFPHIGPVWLGWMRAALGSVQARSVDVKQSGWSVAKPSVARVEYEVSWL